MPSLHNPTSRFSTGFTITQGGSGHFQGVLTEPNQGETPSYQFNLPRRLLRVPQTLPLKSGSLLKSDGGSIYMVGDHGDAESYRGVLFRTFRLFEADRQLEWLQRGKGVDPVTRLPRDTGLVSKGMIWGAYEPSPEMFDRQVRVSFEQARWITTADVQLDDVVDGMKVARVDIQLGLRLVNLG